LSEDGKQYVFLTNNFQLSSLKIADPMINENNSAEYAIWRGVRLYDRNNNS
jgi:hypothetical protein